MKRVICLILIIVFLLPTFPASADWAASFVVFSGDIYEMTDEQIPADVIGQKVGQVTKYSDNEGTYRGNFSNTFPKGTAYYAIKNKALGQEIAIEPKDNIYLKAVNKGHYNNDAIETRYRNWMYFLSGVLILAVVSIILAARRRVLISKNKGRV